MSKRNLGKNMPTMAMVGCLILGGVVSLSLFCNVKKEQFTNRKKMSSWAPLSTRGSEIVGSDLGYSMGDGVKVSYDTSQTKTKGGCNNVYASLARNTQGRRPPLAPGELTLLHNNAQHPLCCPSPYSGSLGCVCETEEQAKYLNMRGGNRTLCGMF